MPVLLLFIMSSLLKSSEANCFLRETRIKKVFVPRGASRSSFGLLLILLVTHSMQHLLHRLPIWAPLQLLGSVQLASGSLAQLSHLRPLIFGFNFNRASLAARFVFWLFFFFSPPLRPPHFTEVIQILASTNIVPDV